MSATATLTSPSTATKRTRHSEVDLGLLSDGRAFCSSPSLALSSKRSKVSHSTFHSPARCAPLVLDAWQHPVYASSFAVLRELHPEMDDKTLSEVLVDCGGNIDAAIQKLNSLSLSAEQSSTAPQACATAHEAAPEQSPSPSPHISPAPDSGPQSAEQWVDFMVTQLAGSASMEEAKHKAAAVLQRFEAFVSTSLQKQVSNDAAALTARLSKVAEENTLLKKAVAIQHRQLQERSAQTEELTALRAAVATAQEQVRALELANYSLSLHLRQATTHGELPHGHRGPDVY